MTQDEVQNDESSKTNVQGAQILLSDKPERKIIRLTTYLMIFKSLMHLIWQTQAITNSTQTSLEFTFQPSSESGTVLT